MQRRSDDDLPGTSEPDPCGCGQTEIAGSLVLQAGGDLPSLDQLDQLLDDLEGNAGVEGIDPASVAADLDLLEAEQLFAGEETPALDQLTAILSEYPGLKITLSY